MAYLAHLWIGELLSRVKLEHSKQYDLRPLVSIDQCFAVPAIVRMQELQAVWTYALESCETGARYKRILICETSLQDW